MFIEAGFSFWPDASFCLSVFSVVVLEGIGRRKVLNICVWVSFWACFVLLYFFNLCHQSRYIWLSQSKITAVCKSLCGGETRDWSKQNFSRMLNKYKCSISTNKWYEIDENKCAKVKAYLLWLEKIWVISVLERDQ